MSTFDHARAIEAILFFKGEPISFASLAAQLSIGTDEVRAALALLDDILSSRGISLVIRDEEAALCTSSDVAHYIDAVVQGEQSRDLSSAALETLSLVLYRSPISRYEIDHVRGVNSEQTLRTLLVRGLIERSPQEASSFSRGISGASYRPSIALLSHLGITGLAELPNYEAIRHDLSVERSENEHTGA